MNHPNFFILSLLTSVLVLTLVSFTSDTSASSNGKFGNTAKTYGGAEPQGDYVAITIDDTNVTYHNYTTGENKGPVSFYEVTDSSVNGGFHNLYQTADFGEGHFARFVIADGVALIYQLFNTSDQKLFHYPVYAFPRRQVSVSSYQNKAFNWIKLRMDPQHGANTDF